MISCDFRKVITISDKIDVRPSETLKKWNVSWEQCIDINQVCHEYQRSDIYMRILASNDLQSTIVGVLFTTFSDFFPLLKLYITRCYYELCWNTKILVKLDKKLRN